MSRSAFSRMTSCWRIRARHILPALALALALMTRAPLSPEPTDSPSQGEQHRAVPLVNWNS